MTTPPSTLVLIDPGSSRHELNEPIGIGTVASAAASVGGVQVRQHFAPIHGMPTGTDLHGVDLLGLSMPLGSMSVARDLANMWRAMPVERRPLLVLGGLLPTFAPDEVLAEFPEAILVIGEGEDAMAGLVRAHREPTTEELRRILAKGEVPNLILQTGDQVVRTPRRLVDLALSPSPDRSLLPAVASRGGIARAEASRGCAWGRCTFCAIQHKYCDEARWRDMPVERILDELTALSHLGIRHPYYTDEDFVGSDPQRAMTLAQAITQAKAKGRIAPDLSLYVDMRGASVLDPGGEGRPSGAEVLGALRRAGLREVFVGIESGSREQVRRYKKPATAGRNLRTLALLRNLGLEIDVGFIFFDPEMSLDEAVANLEFLRTAGLWHHDARLTKELRVEAGTPLVEQYLAKEMLVGPLDVDDLTFSYRWLDSRVEAVHSAFRAWEAQDLSEVYLLQAATRGEVATPQARRDRRGLLGRIRAIEHDALELLVRTVRAGGEPARVKLDLYTEQRRTVLRSWSSMKERAA